MEENIIPVKTGVHIVIDYYRGTFEFRSSNNDNELDDVLSIVKGLASFMNFDDSDTFEMPYGKGRYKYLYRFGDSIDLYLKGPVNAYGLHTCSIELKGQGCREFERRNEEKTWYDFLLHLCGFYDINTTRIDIAIDDYEGKDVRFDWIKKKLDNKEYITTFKRKYYKIHGCNEEGYSLEFGSRTSSQMLVIYEKNKQQLHKNGECLQDYWTRFEMRFMHDKGQRVVNDLIDNYKKSESDFTKFVFGIFYTMLDIKESSNYNDKNIYKEDTHPKWLRFLNDVEKATITKPDPKELRWNKFNNYVRSSLNKFLLVKYIIAGESYFQFNKEVLKELRVGLDVIIEDKNKISQINGYLKDNGEKTISVSDIKNKMLELDKILDDLDVPF